MFRFPVLTLISLVTNASKPTPTLLTSAFPLAVICVLDGSLLADFDFLLNAGNGDSDLDLPAAVPPPFAVTAGESPPRPGALSRLFNNAGFNLWIFSLPVSPGLVLLIVGLDVGEGTASERPFGGDGGGRRLFPALSLEVC